MPPGARGAAPVRRWLLLALAPGLAAAAPLGLADFEAGLARRPEWRLAEGAVALAEAVALREQGNAGLRATTALGAGGFSEPQWPAGSREYGSLSLGLGLRWPILGSASEEELRVASARVDAVVAEARREGERRALLRGLRESFFAYAHAREVRDLASAFLADGPRVREVLRRRQAAGLVLEADRRRVEGAFALAERELRGAEEALRARGDELRRWRPDFGGEVILPPRPVLRLAASPALAEDGEGAPEPPAAARLDAIAAAAPSTGLAARGNLFLAGNVRKDSDLGAAGAVLAGVSIDWPLGGGAGEALRKEREARLGQARLAVARLADEERAAARRARADAIRAGDEAALARARVAAAGAALSAAARRAAIDAGAADAPIERWVEARAALFRELLDLLRTERDEAAAATALDAAAPTGASAHADPAAAPGCGRAAASLLAWTTLEAGPPVGDGAPPCAGAEPPGPAGRALYAWGGARSLERAADERLWAATGATELWLSFGAAEVERLRDPGARAALAAGVARARRHARRVALLLGEPGWLRPGQDEALVATLRILRDVPFDAVHLDVEPAQLAPAPPEREAFTALASLVARAREAFGRPVIVSLHWRDLAPGDGACRGCAAAAAADEVAVMLYSTSPDAVAERMRAILAARPAARVWLVQSIEDALGDEESFASRGRAALDRQLAALAGLERDPAFAGFAVQSLEDWVEARP